jgi:SAM-dependent methyltransferase
VNGFDRSEGQRVFGIDPAAYDRARPGHADGVYDVLVERCGLSPGAAVLEIGSGTGQATRRLLELGADPLVAVEPDPALAEYLANVTGGGPDIRIAVVEEADLPDATFDLAVAASSFHWVDEDLGLWKIAAALRPGGWIALWWTLFGSDDEADAFIEATTPLLEGLETSPSHGEPGRPPYALDVDARLGALRRAGFEDDGHQTMRWTARWDTAGIRELYGTFSPIARLEDTRKTKILDSVARIARDDFEGRVERALVTSLYTARKPT